MKMMIIGLDCLELSYCRLKTLRNSGQFAKSLPEQIHLDLTRSQSCQI